MKRVDTISPEEAARLLERLKERMSSTEPMLDVHRERAAKVFGVAPDDVTSDQRTWVKLRTFGVIYGNKNPRTAEDEEALLDVLRSVRDAEERRR